MATSLRKTAEILIINGHDWSHLVQRKGYGWTRNDLDSDQTTRTKNGTMRREKIATKRKLTFKTLPTTRDKLAQLDEDLSETFFNATFLDLHGPMTREFYCTSFEVTLGEAADGNEQWESATFSIIER